MRLHVMQLTIFPRPFCLSVCLSVRLSNAWIVTKRKKLVPTFLYHTIIHPGFRPFLPEILRQTDPVGAKTPIFNQYSLVAPQP